MLQQARVPVKLNLIQTPRVPSVFTLERFLERRCEGVVDFRTAELLVERAAIGLKGREKTLALLNAKRAIERRNAFFESPSTAFARGEAVQKEVACLSETKRFLNRVAAFIERETSGLSSWGVSLLYAGGLLSLFSSVANEASQFRFWISGFALMAAGVFASEMSKSRDELMGITRNEDDVFAYPQAIMKTALALGATGAFFLQVKNNVFSTGIDILLLTEAALLSVYALIRKIAASQPAEQSAR